jgi:tripartite-type tricarboxylate transporter receptor subunit TctC
LSLYIAPTPELIEQHRAGRAHIVATTGAARSPLLPNVPTIKEQGFNIVTPIWFALYAPAKTPADIAIRLSDATIAVVRSPEVQARIRALGYEPTGTSGEVLRQLQRADFDFWGSVVRASGFKAEQQ